MKHVTKHKQRGSVLLEAIIALAVIVLTVAGISTVVTLSVSNSTFVRSQNNANKLAQDGMEYLRNLKDSDYTTFSTKLFPTSGGASVTICFPEDFDPNNISYAPCAVESPADKAEASLGEFRREVTIYDDGKSNTCFGPTTDPLNPAIKTTTNEVVVDVYWSSGKCSTADRFCHKSELRSCFTKPTDYDLP